MGPVEAHHLISKGEARGNKKVRKLIDVLLVPVCHGHNFTKVADTRWARRILAEGLTYTLATDWLKDYIDAFPWKVQPPHLSYKGIMSGPLPPIDL